MKSLIKSSTLAVLVALSGCANPADDKPEAVVSAPKLPTASAPEATPTAESAPVAAAPAAPGGRVAAITAAESKIGFVGSKVTGSHEGGFKDFSGSIELAPESPEIQKISATINMDSTWSDNDNLTGHLKNQDFFDVPKFPQSTFVTTEIKPGGENGATHTVTGDLTLHGVTKSIQFPAKLAVTDTAASVDSEFFIRRNDFGIVYPGRANDLIRDEVVIKLAIKAPLPSAN